MEVIKSYATKTKYENRIHEVEFENEIPKNWQIKYSNSVIIPKTLVKYYSANKIGFKVLEESKIWATHPFDFNDPFDCSIQLWDIETFPFVETKLFLNNFLPRGFPSEADVYETRHVFLELALRFIGIYCLNEKAKSDLFWGYYNNHKGFSIEFNTEILNLAFGNVPYKIEYKDLEINDKIILNSDLSSHELYPKILRWLTLKKKDWIHENEWRYLFLDIDLGNTNRGKAFPLKAINEIILGNKFFSAADDDKWLNRTTAKFIFKNDLENNYTYKILSFLYKNPEIKLKQVFMNENFTLTEKRIFILKIKDNQVIIETELQ
jgi:hypothetical protein